MFNRVLLLNMFDKGFKIENFEVATNIFLLYKWCTFYFAGHLYDYPKYAFWKVATKICLLYKWCTFYFAGHLYDDPKYAVVKIIRDPLAHIVCKDLCAGKHV
jgi:hypothetical protein